MAAFPSIFFLYLGYMEGVPHSDPLGYSSNNQPPDRNLLLKENGEPLSVKCFQQQFYLPIAV